MTGWTLAAAIIATLIIGAILGVGLLAVFIGAGRDDGPDTSDFDASMGEWGYIGERRAGGKL